ncbi:DUF1127 domain-containing protein [Roseivivax sediminis]|uniref:DUF1127 domain-containing protein n=1 Tax=Roseivivax sediminis TaxID=936889 RepID=A0A1I1WE50_9RHOB|nr:DUF1127 domain-containing protein [Roseivivax sediminis]SFD93417.1 protein of unknown function [Roseivivax sediminis]
MTATDIQSIPQDRSESRGVFGRILDAMVIIAESNPRLRRVEQLQAMSDEKLAEMGLKREDIVRHVFKDTFAL